MQNIQTATCLSSSDWRANVPYNTKMTISKRRASTIFSRSDFTIVDVTDLSDPVPVIYTPEEFFAFYDIIFRIDQNLTDVELTTQFSFLVSVSSLLLANSLVEIDSGGGNIKVRLQEFLACPLVVFNSAVLGLVAEPDMGKSLSFTTPSYRVITYESS